MVDCAGLEIRIQDFGLNWTCLVTGVLVFGNSLVRNFCQSTDVTRTALNFFVWVTL